MTIKVAINGFGRIGRNILRALYESSHRQNIEIVAINDLGDINLNAHLARYDTTHGKFNVNIDIDEDSIIVQGDKIKVFSERDPAKLPWAELNVDVVHECTGVFRTRDKAAMHIDAGAKKVIISAPSKNASADATIVHGVNHNILSNKHQIISNASCTTNCLAPVAKVLNDAVGIEQGQMTTIHAYTNTQNLTDAYHKDIFRARSATQSLIPTKTGAAKAVGLVLPELNGKLDGMAIRVPTINVSLIDLHFTATRKTSVKEINRIMLNAANQGPMSNILDYVDEPLVSIDFNHNPASCNFDSNHTRVIDKMVKVMAWYDNEWGFSNRMLDNTIALMRQS